MKKYLNADSSLCTACGTCEKVCSSLYFKEDNPAKSRIRISKAEQGNHISVCDQCATCVGVCPTMALNRNKQGVVTWDKNLCNSCYMCIAACPKAAFTRFDGGKEPLKCIACGACARKCPTGAIRIVSE